MKTARGRVIGIGGIFLKSPNQEQLAEWYVRNLEIPNGPEGAKFEWFSTEQPARKLLTLWSTFPNSSDYFAPSAAPFMVNYIVDDLDALLEKLSTNGARIDPKREDHEYGRFAWIFDPDGNKIELWEPPKGS